MKGEKESFYHAGDTGYSDGVFKAVGRALGPFSLAALPIGAYLPRVSGRDLSRVGAAR